MSQRAPTNRDDDFQSEAILSFASGLPFESMVVQAGRYHLSWDAQNYADKVAILRFPATITSIEPRGCNPDAEAQLICRALSLYMATVVTASESRFYDKADSAQESLAPDESEDCAEKPLWSRGLVELILRIDSLKPEISKQFLRACKAYTLAQSLGENDAALGFLLAAVAIECLSTQPAIVQAHEVGETDDRQRTCERFLCFIKKFLPQDARGPDETDEQLLDELLRQVYYGHRSSFVHGGSEVPQATRFADRVGSSYFLQAVKGKRTKVPGLVWFTRIVHDTLLGFIDSDRAIGLCSDVNKSIRANIRDQSIVHLIAARPVSKGKVLSLDDIRYRED